MIFKTIIQFLFPDFRILDVSKNVIETRFENDWNASKQQLFFFPYQKTIEKLTSGLIADQLMQSQPFDTRYRRNNNKPLVSRNIASSI